MANQILWETGEKTIKDQVIVHNESDTSGDNADFYGTNAAVLVKGGTLTISGGSVTTNGTHANAVFAYGGGVVNVTGTKIVTQADTSGGIMVTGGGTLNAKNVTVETAGKSSAAIRSDRGGGLMKVVGGTFTSHGQGSPAIYSTADIRVSGATLVSTASEGVVIEGLNSVTLNKVKLTDTNTKINGNSTTYKNIFIYQSMSGDAKEGTGTFTAKNCEIVTNNGDDFFITNTTAVINLSGNTITNTAGGGFLRAQAGKWGTSGSNGGKVTLNAENQTMKGDIFIDGISTLEMNLTSSTYEGTINAANSAKEIKLKLDAGSKVVLTGDSYVTSVEGEGTVENNGYTLHVGEEVAETETVETTETDSAAVTENGQSLPVVMGVLGGVVVLTIVVTTLLTALSKKRSSR